MKIKYITSPNNQEFRFLLKLKKVRGIKKHGMALFSGKKQVKEVLRDFPDSCLGIIFSEDMETPPEAVMKYDGFYNMSPSLFRQIDMFDTRYPILLVSVSKFRKWSKELVLSGCTLCIPFQDPVNVGAVIRSSAAFGASGLVMLKEAAHPFHPRSIRAAGSQIFKLPIFEGPSLYDLRVSGCPVVGLSPKGRSIEKYRFPSAFCLVPGLEGPGLPEGLGVTEEVSIPMEDGVESINAALATGIALYLWRKNTRENM